MRIALIGSAPSSIRLAPFDDPTWEIWGCSPGAYPVCKRVTSWFELHRWEPPVVGNAEKQVPWFSPEYVQWMAQLKCHVFTAGLTPELPNAVLYPVDDMIKLYGPYFFTSSLSWMFAAALEAPGITEIGLWGVDMAAQEEYGDQRLGCQYFITLAKQRGIKITVPSESDLLMPRMLYGVGEWSPKMIKMTARLKELQGRKNAADQQAQAARDQGIFLSGAIDNHNYMLSTWMQNEPPEVFSHVEDKTE